jgi:hypothetical protein
MEAATRSFVPKVHPASRPIEADDPFSLQATAVGGDVEIMLECLVQEYAWLGFSTEQLVGLFRDPNYPMLNAVLDHYGEADVRRRIGIVLERMGVLRVTGSISDVPEPTDEEADLIELDVSKLRIPTGERHGEGF